MGRKIEVYDEAFRTLFMLWLSCVAVALAGVFVSMLGLVATAIGIAGALLAYSYADEGKIDKISRATFELGFGAIAEAGVFESIGGMNPIGALLTGVAVLAYVLFKAYVLKGKVPVFSLGFVLASAVLGLPANPVIAIALAYAFVRLFEKWMRDEGIETG